jgi:hypothetical protein
MRDALVREAELDALHARAAVAVTECEQLLPGPGMAARLVALQGMAMDCAAALRTAALWTRLGGWCEARAMVAVSEAVTGAELLAGADPLDATKLAGEELAVMTHVSSITAMNRVALVAQVARTLPLSWEALDRGEISLAHLKRLADIVAGASARVATLVEGVVIPAAVRAGWTPYELSKEASLALLEIDPDGAAERVKHASTTTTSGSSPNQTRTRP